MREFIEDAPPHDIRDDGMVYYTHMVEGVPHHRCMRVETLEKTGAQIARDLAEYYARRGGNVVPIRSAEG